MYRYIIYIYTYVYTYIPIYTYIYIYIYKIYIFTTGQNGGRVSTPTSLKFAQHPKLEKIPSSTLPNNHLPGQFYVTTSSGF